MKILREFDWLQQNSQVALAVVGLDSRAGGDYSVAADSAAVVAQGWLGGYDYSGAAVAEDWVTDGDYSGVAVAVDPLHAFADGGYFGAAVAVYSLGAGG